MKDIRYCPKCGSENVMQIGGTFINNDFIGRLIACNDCNHRFDVKVYKETIASTGYKPTEYKHNK